MRFWTVEEVELLKELYPNPDVSREDLEKVFNRNWDGIRRKAWRLKLERVEHSLINYEYLEKLRKKLPERVIE